MGEGQGEGADTVLGPHPYLPPPGGKAAKSRSLDILLGSPCRDRITLEGDERRSPRIDNEAVTVVQPPLWRQAPPTA